MRIDMNTCTTAYRMCDDTKCPISGLNCPAGELLLEGNLAVGVIPSSLGDAADAVAAAFHVSFAAASVRQALHTTAHMDVENYI